MPTSSLSLPLIALFLSCTAGGDPDASPPPTPQDTGEDPAPLAEYPGAPFEDKRGNLWISTVFEGLIRYDGTDFVTFTTQDGLASDSIRDILEDKDGLLWIATTGGVSTYDGTSFTTLTEYGDIPLQYTFTSEGDHRDVWDVHQDRQGSFWIATAGGVFRLEGSTFIPFPLPVLATQPNFEFTPKMVYHILEDQAGHLWFGTDGAGAMRYDGTTTTVYTQKDHGLASDRICTLLQDSQGDFWFGTSDGGVSHFDGTTFTTHLRSPSFSEHTGWGRFMAIAEDREGGLWFGAASRGGGVYRYDGEVFRHFSKDEGLGDGAVPSIRIDRSGHIWLGSTSGVFRFDGERFVHFTKSG